MKRKHEEPNAELDALLLEDTPTNEEASAEDWRVLLDAKADANLLDYPVFAGKSLRQLLTELSGAQSLIGRKGLIKPKDDDKAEVWNAFYQKLGRPDKADDYTLDFADVEDTDWYSDELKIHMRGLMHDAGLTGHQASHVAAGFKEYLKSAVDETQVLEKAEGYSQQLADLWGDEADANEAAAERGAREIGLNEDLTAKLPTVGDTVQVWNTLARIGKAQSEDSGAGRWGTSSLRPSRLPTLVAKARSKCSGSCNRNRALSPLDATERLLEF